MLVTSTAKLRYVSVPARKMRFVANAVKGMPVQKALDILNFTPRLAARHIAKTVKSAAANALSEKGTDALRPETLVIKNILVDEAPTMKRIRFQSMGRVFRIRKRFCHLTVHLEGLLEEESSAKAARKRAAAAAKTEEDAEATSEKTTGTPAKKKAKAGAKKAAPGARKDKTGGARVAKTKKTAKASASKTTAKKSKKAAGAGK